MFLVLITFGATGIASEPRAVVQAFIDTWARSAINDVVNLFAEELAYRSLALDTTSRLVRSWHVEYWMATNGKMALKRCDRGSAARPHATKPSVDGCAYQCRSAPRSPLSCLGH